MIEVALAAEVLKWLAPTLPYILASTSEAAKSFGKKIGEETFKKAQDLYHLLSPAIEGKPSAKEAVIDASKAPEDGAVLGALEMQLRKILEKDPELTASVKALIEGNRSAGESIIAFGERSIAVRTSSNSTLNTGDNNSFSSTQTK